MKLTADQLKKIAGELFLMQPDANRKLPVPKKTPKTATKDFAKKFDAIAADADFSKWGIGVIDFTKDKFNPDIWLLNEGKPWRIGSTGKIAIILAAVQLRADVRAIQFLKILSTPQDFDDLFAMDALWRLSPVTGTGAMASKATAPRISTIFDFTRSDEADFQGPRPGDAAFADIIDRLAAKTTHSVATAHLKWPLNTEFAFSERFWLAGANSDNVGADSCMSEIGVAYVRAVQRAYGLFDPRKGMHMLVNGPYSHMNDDHGGVTTVPITTGSTVFYRNLQGPEMVHVTDALKKGATFSDQDSWEAGSAASLTAYMIAFIQQRFTATSTPFKSTLDAFETIKANLSHGNNPRETSSFIAEGVKKVANVKLELSKVGLLGTDEGERGSLNTEFAYLETEEKTGTHQARQYGVVVTGIQDSDDTDATDLTENLGKAIHLALSS
jgi:hypothetical protein